MHSLAIAVLFAASTLAQTTPATTTATPSPLSLSGSTTTVAAASGNLQDAVNYLLPSQTITLSPSQSRQVVADAQSFFTAYAQSHPVAQLQADFVAAELFASATPNAALQSSLQQLVGGAQTALLLDPSGFVQSVNAIVSPFPFAAEATSYEDGLVAGLRTIVAHDLNVLVPGAPTAGATSTGAAANAVPTGFLGGAAAALAAGAVGLAML